MVDKVLNRRIMRFQTSPESGVSGLKIDIFYTHPGGIHREVECQFLEIETTAFLKGEVGDFCSGLFIFSQSNSSGFKDKIPEIDIIGVKFFLRVWLFPGLIPQMIVF